VLTSACTHKDITDGVDNPSNDSPGSDGEDKASGACIPIPPLEGALMTFANLSANLLNLYQVENHPLRKHGHARKICRWDVLHKIIHIPKLDNKFIILQMMYYQ